MLAIIYAVAPNYLTVTISPRFVNGTLAVGFVSWDTTFDAY
jgi:hypothetical protein